MPSPGYDASCSTPSDAELDAFFDSLVWEEWEPSCAATHDQQTQLPPVTLKRLSTGSVEVDPTDPGLAGSLDPDLKLLIESWGCLDGSARISILELVQAAREHAWPGVSSPFNYDSSLGQGWMAFDIALPSKFCIAG